MFAIVICLVLLMCTLTIWCSVLGRRYVCCSQWNVVSNEPTPALCNLSARTVVKLFTLGVFSLGVSLVS